MDSTKVNQTTLSLAQRSCTCFLLFLTTLWLQVHSNPILGISWISVILKQIEIENNCVTNKVLKCHTIHLQQGPEFEEFMNDTYNKTTLL